ncbi:MAG: hypothetical protein YHS30scaffold667_63 [Phage 65_10]|nr:MAG: hypothetical protein YHS30scaffold667_63 [Phage 65_10]
MGELFKLGDAVRIQRSGEVGTIVGRAVYLDSAPSNMLRYKTADGRYSEIWVVDSELELVS